MTTSTLAAIAAATAPSSRSATGRAVSPWAVVAIRSRIYFSRYYMTPQVEKGLVARTDPDNPMSPRQEYKLA